MEAIFIKIGFLVLSLTKSIPYLTCLVSLGYDVFPIIMKNDLNKKETFFVELIKSITNKDLIEDNLKFDCLIVVSDTKKLNLLKHVDYSNILEEDATIIFNSFNIHNLDKILLDFPQENFCLINYNSNDVVDNCNKTVKCVEKLLQKK